MERPILSIKILVTKKSGFWLVDCHGFMDFE